MSNSPRLRRSRPAPLSVRLNSDELGRLKARAGATPLSTYMKQSALGDDRPVARRPRAPIADQVLLGRVLARFGQSRLSDSLTQLAHAARLGTLPVSDATEEDLRAACADVAAIRVLLMQALGKAVAEPAEPESLTEQFQRASAPEGCLS